MNLAEKILVVLDPMSYNICAGGKGGFGYINAHMTFEDRSQKSKSYIERAWNTKLKKYGDLLFQDRHTLEGRRKKSIQRKQECEVVGGPFKGKSHTETTKLLIGTANKVNRGALNSQFNTMWITNGVESKKVSNQSEIPIGFYKGRTLRKEL